jgi:hypothetical protein
MIVARARMLVSTKIGLTVGVTLFVLATSGESGRPRSGSEDQQAEGLLESLLPWADLFGFAVSHARLQVRDQGFWFFRRQLFGQRQDLMPRYVCHSSASSFLGNGSLRL